MIQIREWSRRVALGGVAVVAFGLVGANGRGLPERPVVELRIDGIGDGRPGVVVRGEDLRAVTGLAIRLEVPGTHSLEVEAIDAAGCSDRTRARREVVVR